MNERPGLGWLHDFPDVRDYTPDHEEVAPALKAVQLGQRAERKSLPSQFDLRYWCSPVEDQGSLGSCTANAGVGLVEYFERRAHNNHIDASRLFLYKVTRQLLHWTGDTGAFLRTTMGALVLFGVPPRSGRTTSASSTPNQRRSAMPSPRTIKPSSTCAWILRERHLIVS